MYFTALSLRAALMANTLGALQIVLRMAILRWRCGRVVECTSLENWRGFTALVSSNLTASASIANGPRRAVFVWAAACSISDKHRARGVRPAVWRFVQAHLLKRQSLFA